jgi:AraC family transcriptional regulator
MPNDRTTCTDLERSERRAAYKTRINRAVDFIERNLEGELTLEAMAKEASFSPYHFHRVFGAFVGETVSRFVQRTRIEKAASLLIQHRRKSVTEIALECGFSSPAVFARSFKQAFGMSATAWRNGGHPVVAKYHDADFGDPEADYGILSFRRDPKTTEPRWRIRCPGHDPVSVREQTLPPWRVAYARHTGPYQGMAAVFERLFTTLMTWATPRGLLTEDARVLAVYHDDPYITDDDKLRVSACLTVPDGTLVDGEIGSMTLAGGRYAMGRFELGEKDYARAWHALMGGWLPESGFEPDDRPCFELYHNDCSSHPEGKSVVDICIPVRPLQLQA